MNSFYNMIEMMQKVSNEKFVPLRLIYTFTIRLQKTHLTSVKRHLNCEMAFKKKLLCSKCFLCLSSMISNIRKFYNTRIYSFYWKIYIIYYKYAPTCSSITSIKESYALYLFIQSKKVHWCLATQIYFDARLVLSFHINAFVEAELIDCFFSYSELPIGNNIVTRNWFLLKLFIDESFLIQLNVCVNMV